MIQRRLAGKRSINIIEKYVGYSPEYIAEREGIVICTLPDMPQRFEDCIIFKTIFLPADITSDERQWRIGHCLGHYFMHSQSVEGLSKMWCQDRYDIGADRDFKREFQADCFAVYILSHMED